MCARRSLRAMRVLALVALLASACSSGEEPWFRECAREKGLDFVHVRGEQRFWFPEIMGGGVALLDYDQDGWLDAYLVQGGDLAAPSPEHADRLYQNAGDGSFRPVEDSGAGDPGYGMGCAAGDADGDGTCDLFVTNVGPDTLYLNRHGEPGADAVFADVSEHAGVRDKAWSTSAAFFDPDADGDLDLFVTNYVRWSPELEIECRSPYGEPDYCSPNNYDAPTRDVLYRNEGDGRFTDVSEAAGLASAFGNGLGVVTADLDEDGKIDVYVANDQMQNQLWINQGELAFVDRALYAGCAVNKNGASEAGMGVVAVDVEEDGDLDLFITHLREETNTLYANQGGLFSDQTAARALGAASLPYTGFGADIADFDHDGLLDVFVANGAVTQNRVRFDPDDPYAEPILFQRGVASGAGVSFEEVQGGGSAPPSLGNARGAAFGDVDNDGDLDALVVDNGARVRFFENLRGARGHWIQLSVLEKSGAHALGARVRVEAGTRSVLCNVQSDGSYCSASDPRVHVGLGKSGAPVEAHVRWVDGSEQRFGPLDVDRVHVLRRAVTRER